MSMAALVLIHRGLSIRSISLDRAEMLIGRHSGSDIQLDDDSVSGRHARLSRVESPYLEGHYDIFLEDLGSTNGTDVNARRVSGVLRLQNGDWIRIGRHHFRFELEPDPGTESTAILLPESDRG